MESPRPRSGKTSSVILVLGGARSGKSRYAESLLADRVRRRVYLATAEAGDEEMRLRIRHHRARRGEDWRTIESPIDIAASIASAGGDAVLVDCLTLWLSNLMAAERDIDAATDELCRVLAQAQAPVVLVSNETGLGIVPDNALARQFRDRAGQLNQAVAAMADRVFFIAAGLPLTLKDSAA
jgi:adenosylcobinamide kinase / adenosylcobinamide-phosphate guanylyltransferase